MILSTPFSQAVSLIILGIACVCGSPYIRGATAEDFLYSTGVLLVGIAIRHFQGNPTGPVALGETNNK